MADIFIDEDDISLILRGLIDINRDSIDNLEQLEYALIETMRHDDSPPNANL